MDIQAIRNQISSIDDKMIEILMQRLGMVKEIAMIKKKKNIPVEDTNRENKILKKIESKIPDEKIPYVKLLFESLFKISKKYQKDYINGKMN